MRPLVAAAALAVVVLGGAAVLHWPTPQPHWEVVDRYCVSCHNETELAGELSFDDVDRADVGRDAAVWEAVVRKLRTGLMPPKGEPRPARSVLDRMAAELELNLDAAATPNPGAKPLARLNRTEYTNSVSDLLAFDATSIASTLPPDSSAGGFDNIAAALTVSPTLLEAYALAAMQLSRRAVGDRTMGHGETRYAAPGGAAQQRHLEGLPLGTRGGLAVVHQFPLDAEYELAVQASLPIAGWDNPTGRLVYCNGPSLELAMDGVPIELDGGRRARVRAPAGPHEITVALVDEQRCTGVREFYAGEVELGGAVTGLVIGGPYGASGVGDTPSRREIFVCRPSAASAEAPCAAEILTRLATRAYRKLLPQDSDEIRPLLDAYELGRAEGGDFEVGIQYALARLLVDPQFIYRFEREPDDVEVGRVYAIGDFELATRLAFFLWSSIPDDALLAAAAAGELRDAAALAAQVERLLADPKAQRFVESFAGQWLRLRELDELPSQDLELDADLRAAFRRETELLFGEVLRERRSVLELLDADYTYLNDRLAAHYGIGGVHDTYLRRVELPPDSPRRGLLGHGSILTATSAPNRTSPVVRGQWIVQNILGAAVPTPPPGVEADLAKEASEAEGLRGDTVRERLEMHRANPTCAACHAIMDPLGLALENFDLVGRWREHEDGHAIDATAELADGTKLAGAADLRRALLSRSEAFVTSLTERLLTYALGRELEASDQPVVRDIIRSAAADGTTLAALVQAIVASDAFRKRVKTGSSTAAPAAVAER